ncbi:MAG: AraC family transcriptional regulator [Anaerolineae bacterium]|nr:AraC family transcriptional regulator [Anaerolineae bacterium]MCA9891761.1 AraC family transcriptional regulator [Anaerolineae bacterium]
MGDNQLDEREALRMQANREELIECISSVLPEDGLIEPIKGLYLGRLSALADHNHGVLKPSFCVIAQGSKEVYLGKDRYQYDPFNYLLATVDLPTVTRVIEASKERPYLSFRLELDPNLVGSILVEAGHILPRANTDMRALDVSSLDGYLLDAVVRLTRLADSPDEARVLMPLITREIIYRLLTSDQGTRLCHMVASGSYASNVVKAIKRLRSNFDQSLRVEDMAQELGMSVSSFHSHFKAVTAMSPLQFQKRLRLQEARRLMLSEDVDATSAAYQVGYNDASHFSREYKSLFGEPPIRDVQRLREEVGENMD